MKGKILNYKADKGFGFILGQDNQKYFFHVSKVINPNDIRTNYTVDFTNERNQKGLSAIDITIFAPSIKKDKILKIGETRLWASEIKRYKGTTSYDFDVYDDTERYNCIEIETFDNDIIRVLFKWSGYEEALKYLDNEMS